MLHLRNMAAWSQGPSKRSPAAVPPRQRPQPSLEGTLGCHCLRASWAATVEFLSEGIVGVPRGKQEGITEGLRVCIGDSVPSCLSVPAPPGSSLNDELHSKQHKPNALKIRPELAFQPVLPAWPLRGTESFGIGHSRAEGPVWTRHPPNVTTV